MDRRSSTSSRRTSRSSHSSTPNLFSDEYALQSVDLETDRRPSLDGADGEGELPRARGSPEERPQQVRQSMQKPRFGSMSRDSPHLLAMRQEYDRRASPSRSITSLSDAVSTFNAGSTTRTTSLISRAQSPYRGPSSGPSQPYGMYTQDTNLARTPSIATAATARQPERLWTGATAPSHPYALYSQNISLSRSPSTVSASTMQRPERSYSGPSGSTQPYGLFAQNTVSENGSDPFRDAGNGARVAYPAGSRPAPQAHQRRLGPDGEDIDDLIGPDGFAEQLPPYSRYPNNIPPKRDPDASSFINIPGPSTDPTPTPAHNPLPIANPTPIQQRQSDQMVRELPDAHENTILVRHALEQTSSHQNPFNDSSTQVSSTTAVDSLPKEAKEQCSFTQRAQRRGKRKICCGMIPCWLLISISAICIAIIIGGIMGGVLAHNDGVKKGVQTSLAQASATPVETVTSIVPAQTPEEAAPLPTPTGVVPIPTGIFSVKLDGPSIASSSCLEDAAQNNAWDCSVGATLNIVVNEPPPGQGSSPYVDLEFPPPNKNIRYGAQPPQLSGATNLILAKDTISPERGDAYTFQQPVNKTVIVRAEDFPGAIPNVKRDLNWSWRRWAGRRSTAEDRASSLNRREQESDWNQTDIAGPTDRPWLCFWNGTMLYGFIYVTENSAAGSANDASKRSVLDKRGGTPYTPEYPKAMKITEKRKKVNTIKPYCQQMQVLNNGQLNPVAHENGSLNRVDLTEIQSDTIQTNVERRARSGKDAQQSQKRGTHERCQCAWKNL